MTPTARSILKEMERADEEIVCDGLLCYLDLRQTSWVTVKQLLSYLAISDRSDTGGGCKRFSINSTGRSIIRRPKLAGEIEALMRRPEAFTIRDDRIVILGARP